MSRPENVSDISESDLYIEVASFQLDRIGVHPKFAKAYADFAIVAATFSARIETAWGSTVKVSLPKNRKQLDEQLEMDQRAWDNAEKLYNKTLRGEFVQKYRQYTVKQWADAEGLAEPVFVDEPVDDEES